MQNMKIELINMEEPEVYHVCRHVCRKHLTEMIEDLMPISSKPMYASFFIREVIPEAKVPCKYCRYMAKFAVSVIR